MVKKIIATIMIFTMLMSCEIYAEDSEELSLQSKSVILMERDTGTVLYENNCDEKLSPASITKIMTLILIFDNIQSGKIKLDDLVETSEHAKSMGGSQVFLETGEKQTVETLIKCIIIASGNDASVAMAEYIGGSEEAFVKMMNERAKELGMNNTHFVDCCGLTDSDNHYSSARDVAIMSRELVKKYPQIHDYSSIWMETITHVTDKGEKEFVLSNTNKLLKQYEYANGLKTGSTSKAKYCVSATANKEDMELIAVVMCAPDYKVRFSEARTLLEYGFNKCNIITESLTNKVKKIKIKNSKNQKTDCVYQYDFTYVSINGEKKEDISKKIYLDKNIEAPLKKGAKVGVVKYFLKDKEIACINIITKKQVDRIKYMDKVFLVIREFIPHL